MVQILTMVSWSQLPEQLQQRQHFMCLPYTSVQLEFHVTAMRYGSGLTADIVGVFASIFAVNLL